VTRRLGVDITNDYGAIVLVDEVGSNLAGDDAAKQAIWFWQVIWF
jgi:hypothetical protein